MLTLIANLALFAAGVLFLLYGAHSLIKGAASIAKRWRLPPIFVGLTLVAFGTSLPELVVSISASLGGSADIAVGNIIGSSIANVLLILGIAAVIYPLTFRPGTIAKEIPFTLLASFILLIVANDTLFSGSRSTVISRGDGVLLISFFLLFLYYTFNMSSASMRQHHERVKVYHHSVAFSLVIGGILGLVFGGQAMVSAASALARFFGASEALIGLTIVAVGTSLPELATSAVAAYRRQSDLAIGNIVGSNIFNIFLILGLSAVIRPLAFNPSLTVDIFVNIVVTGVLLLFMYVGKRNVLQRWQGLTLVGLYGGYLLFLVIRG